MYKIVKVVPKYSELDNSLIGYNIFYARDGSDFHQSKLYLVSEAKSLFNITDVSSANSLVGKEILLKIELKK